MTEHNGTSFPRTAVITLAIGIGAATAVITVAEALLIRPLPVAAEDQLAILYGATADGKFPNVPITLDELTGFRRQSRALQQVAYHTFRGAATETFNAADRPVQLRISLVSGNWFDVLGAQPSLGRTFRQEEDTRGNNDIIFVSLSDTPLPDGPGKARVIVRDASGEYGILEVTAAIQRMVPNAQANRPAPTGHYWRCAYKETPG